jgi:hypothetical protein
VPVSADGTTTILYRSRDAAGNLEEPHVAQVMIDGVAPTTRAWPAAVARGRKVRLHYQVNDALPGCGEATVTLKIFRRTRLVKQLALPDVRPCNVQLTHVWRCSLARGRYTVKVYATDIAGNAQATVGKATLTVR